MIVLASTESAPRRQAADPDAVDVVDAQLSALLESVEADRAQVPRATERSATGAIRPRPRRRNAGPNAQRRRGRRRADVVRARAEPRSARKAEPARTPFFSDPARRETAYYLLVAAVIATALGVLCVRLLT